MGLTDKNGNKLIEDGFKGIHTIEVITKVMENRGAHNEFVRWIQKRLIALGFSSGIAGADSFFGPDTLLAVQYFQTSRGLKPDGIVGPLTIVQLLK